MTKPIADRQSPHLALTLVAGFAAAFAQHRFLLRNCGAVRAKHFTRIRSSHMPEPRLICVSERIKLQSRTTLLLFSFIAEGAELAEQGFSKVPTGKQRILDRKSVV